MTEQSEHDHEFICCECGRHIVRCGERSEFRLCMLCISVPGWFYDTALADMLDPIDVPRTGSPPCPSTK